MHRVMTNVGLSLKEAHLRSSSAQAGAAPFAVLIPGLARGCHSIELMQAVLQPCIDGRASMTLLLQFDSGTEKSKNDEFDELACRSNIESIISDHTAASKCALVFGSQKFSYVGAQNTSCESSLAGTDNLGNRVTKQTLAVGRSFDWAQYHLPRLSGGVEPQFYVRARLDDVGWCLPEVTTLPRYSFVSLNNFKVNEEQASGLTSPLVSDRFAIMPASTATAYFGAWRVWEELNCTHPCWAGRGNSSWLRLECVLAPTGMNECVLNTWLTSSSAPVETARSSPAPGPRWLSTMGSGAGDTLIRQFNTSHVQLGFDPSESDRKISYISASEVLRKHLGGQCSVHGMALPRCRYDADAPYSEGRCDGAPTPPCAGGLANGSTCCNVACGTCGGSTCSSEPGGAAACCSNTIQESGVTCSQEPYQTACIINGTTVPNNTRSWTASLHRLA